MAVWDGRFPLGPAPVGCILCVLQIQAGRQLDVPHRSSCCKCHRKNAAHSCGSRKAKTETKSVALLQWGTIGLVAWDACLNLMLSIMFALKCRSKALALDSPLRGLAMRTLGVTGISTVTSLVNITVMAALKYELGAVCLSLCTLDVLVDALTLALLTSSRYDARDSRLARTPKYHPEEERLQASIKAPSIIHMVKCEVEEKTPVQSAWAHDMVVELAVPPSAAAAGVPTFLHGDQYEGRWANDYLEEVHSESKSRDRTEAYV